MKIFVLICALALLFTGNAANATEFEGAEKNLPSLVMLSTPT